MCDNFENRILVYELKGLLDGLSHYVTEAKYNLAFDNVCDLSDKLNEARKIIDKIDCVIRERVDNENDTEDEFI